MRVLVLLPMALLSMPLLLAGCLECQPLLEVSQCATRDACDDGVAQEAEWGEAEAEAFPRVHALLTDAEADSHEHLPWSAGQTARFADHFGQQDHERKGVLVQVEGDWQRLRVVACG